MGRVKINMYNHKRWIICTCMAVAAACAAMAAVTVYIDPFFHYHKPLSNYAYPLSNERYQNDGISRHFDYDGIITGTSLTANFKTTEADRLFDADFIKVPFGGARYKEVNDNLKRAFSAGKNVRYIIRCLDSNMLAMNKDEMRYDVYPAYLYNNNLFDDLSYVLNKETLIDYTLNAISFTREMNKTTSFDEYSNWSETAIYGAENVFLNYELGEQTDIIRDLTDEDVRVIGENIKQNVTDLAMQHPETQFYLYFPPYSICYWDKLDNDGQVYWQIDVEQTAIEVLLECPNIKLYSFNDNFDLICNLDNYRDSIHYGEWINSYILQCMKNNEYLLTKDNYEEYLDTIRSFYSTYDYTSLHR